MNKIVTLICFSIVANFSINAQNWQNEKGLTSKMMSYLMYINPNTYRNYKSNGVLNQKLYERLVYNYKRKFFSD